MSQYTADDGEEQEEKKEVELLASLSASAGSFEELLQLSSLQGEVDHSTLYLNILEDEVRVLQAAPGWVLLTYCTFGEDFFDEISIERDMRKQTEIDSTGEEFKYNAGVEVILEVASAQTFIDEIHERATLKAEFFGTGDERLASTAKINSTEKGRVKKLGGHSNFNNIPHWLPRRFSSNDVFTNASGDEAPTRVKTESSKLETVAQTIDIHRKAEFYPIGVWDGEFMVGAESVEGPSVSNYYFDGFREIFSTLSGPVELQTAPDDNPMAVVQKGENRVIRHIIGALDT